MSVSQQMPSGTAALNTVHSDLDRSAGTVGCVMDVSDTSYVYGSPLELALRRAEQRERGELSTFA